MRARRGRCGRQRAAAWTLALLLVVGAPCATAAAASPRTSRTAPEIPRIGEVHGHLSAKHRSEIYPLLPLAAGETLDVRLEGGAPRDFVLTVEASSGEKIAKAAPSRDGGALVLAWRLPAALPEGQIHVAAAPDAAAPGPFRLIAALEHPEILRGGPVASGKPVMVIPQVVQIGIKLQQIVDIDQKAENFDAVATLRMDWKDPALAYDPVACRCRFQVMTLEEFQAFVANRDHHWPAFTILNQQRREAGSRIEPREAGPVDRSIPPDERSRLRVADQRVVVNLGGHRVEV